MAALTRILPWLAVAVLLGVVSCQDRRTGVLMAERDRARAESRRLARAVRTADVVYLRDTVRLWRTVNTYSEVRVRDTLVRNDTVFIPRIVADNAVASCKATVLSCEARVAKRDGLLASQARELAASRALENRPYWSVGPEYDALSGGIGGYVERDLWRFRAGVSVTPERIGVRVGVRW